MSVNGGMEQAKMPGHENRMGGASPFFNTVLIVFAIVGFIAVAGIVGMGAMHVGMMGGFGSCGTQTDSVRQQ